MDRCRNICINDAIMEIYSQPNRRVLHDRRRKPTGPVDSLRSPGRRRRCQRTEERLRPHFVDQFGTGTLITILLIIALCVCDAVLTVNLIGRGATEMNPVMSYTMQMGLVPFLIIKYVLTVVGLPLAVIFQSHYLLRTPLRVGHSLVCVTVFYVVLVAYELYLMGQTGAFSANFDVTDPAR